MIPSSESAKSLLNLTSQALDTQETAAGLLGAKSMEYDILELDAKTSAAQLKSALQIYGKHGYDCAPLDGPAERLRFLCKRTSSDIAGKLEELSGTLLNRVKPHVEEKNRF
jgi:hypothetical protein